MSASEGTSLSNARESSIEDHARATSPQSPVPKADRKKQTMAIRVLIADPDTSALATYDGHLSCEGFAVLTTTNGLDCMLLLSKFHPDVLVLEPALPWGGGDGVLSRMFLDGAVPPVPVILIVGGRDEGAVLRSLEFNVEDCLIKPVNMTRLALRIRQIIDPRGAQSLLKDPADPSVVAVAMKSAGRTVQ